MAQTTREDQSGDLSYRADIDGMRAIAVLSVALYHAKISGFSGGYVGVDIFFVISGFLITRLIATGAKDGSYSYWEFYERRARRLLPALFVVAVAVIAFTLAYRSPRDADIFGESVSLFAIFAANVFFYNQLDYFADPVEFYPLLHTWSLAVEEQFYLLFPPLFLALWRWRPNRVTAALALIAVLSFIAAVIAVAYDPQLAFFHTPFRMWQLMAGGLIALVPPLFVSLAARERAAALGVALMLAPVALYDHNTPFPGLAALPPTLGAALVIAAGVGAAAGRPAQALAWSPLVFVGLCSYSFYLWHWPALSAARYLSFEPLSLVNALMVLAAAFALSVITWRFVERPFRRRDGVLPRHGVFAGALSGIAGMLLLGWALQETNGLPGRFPGLEPVFAEDARRYGPSAEDCAPARSRLPEALRAEIDPNFCVAVEAAPDRPRLLLWGDSHARALAPGLIDWAKARNAAFYLAWSPICPPLAGVDRPGGPSRFHDCARHNAAVAQTAASVGATHVILAAQWSRYATHADLAEALPRTAEALRQGGATPVVIAEAPPQAGHVPTLVFRAAVIGSPYPLNRDLETLLKPLGESPASVAQAAREAGAALLSPATVLCPEGLCAVAAEDGAPLYADAHHLNRRGARQIGDALGAQIDLTDHP